MGKSQYLTRYCSSVSLHTPSESTRRTPPPQASHPPHNTPPPATHSLPTYRMRATNRELH
ncbi:hypothetical protein DMX78_02075 [Cutibacterium acnes]|uniref:Uncharacterized protein n=1 Tax=Cutibacterium acnes TaxID=1747 RepID=A0AAD0QPN9_CUTAC|nr:hypothetical protein DXN06_07010 [Cutibacterium acnes]EFS72029.1 hypothetical protein HMPREF9617_00739 [Cutibacterium acnes HL056PA1]EFT21051.1 hypothetical protein HMPREF9566_00684 [Cutibacterium acnes HL045PA1]EFT29499.1 hypothetical protein HMPREF9594_00535 [Cutibacterium acnes HL005PA1]EFT50835.1 hypothetical protein HMPREF9565_00956 [Cutibacterium acnes HL053PA2]EGE94037.1 hypothetical protein HMPREF9570_01667 [Cutibacterium acnes HL043PA1]EGE97085.1 hypothetical protein HMPREF9571_00